MIVFVYNTKCRLYAEAQIKKVINRIIKKYQQIIIISNDYLNQLSLKNITYLIFTGGDGSFNQIINQTSEFDLIYGYIPLGTANDMSHNLKTETIDIAIDKINNKNVKKIPIYKVNNKYFVYALSIGTLSNVSLKTTKAEKRLFKKYIYIIKGVKYLFDKRKYALIKEIDNIKIIRYKTIVILKTNYLGGIKVNCNQDLQIIVINSCYDLFKLFITKNKMGTVIKDKVTIFSESLGAIDGEQYSLNMRIIERSNKQIKLLN